jgi:seryl-tRNA synthetase
MAVCVHGPCLSHINSVGELEAECVERRTHVNELQSRINELAKSDGQQTQQPVDDGLLAQQHVLEAQLQERTQQVNQSSLCFYAFTWWQSCFRPPI